MTGVLRSLRKLLLGETRSIPVGVAATLGVALLTRHGLDPDTWAHAGGFIVAALIAATLALGLRIGR